MVTGTNLANATAVKFGNTAGTVTADTATSITVTSPAGAGTVDVTVTTAGGTSATSSADQFTYTAVPTVTAVSPSAGPLGGTTGVIVTGTNLTGQTAVDFGTTAGTVTADTGTSITVNAPAESAGTVDVTVTTPVGTSPTSSADHFTYTAAPTVTAVSPTSGPGGGGTSVTVTGTDLANATAVEFGTTAGTVTADTATSITVTSPVGRGNGRRDCHDGWWHLGHLERRPVHLHGGTDGDSRQPDRRTPGRHHGVIVTGTNLTGQTAVKFGTTAGTVTADTADVDHGQSPAGSAGTVDVTVTTAGGTSATSSADHFTYIAAPTVTAVSPRAGPLAGGTSVTVTGTNLTGANRCRFRDHGRDGHRRHRDVDHGQCARRICGHG